MEKENPFHRFHLNIAEGSRICWLCKDKIRKGDRCITTSIGFGQYGKSIHIHLNHLSRELLDKLMVEEL